VAAEKFTPSIAVALHIGKTPGIEFRLTVTVSLKSRLKIRLSSTWLRLPTVMEEVPPPLIMTVYLISNRKDIRKVHLDFDYLTLAI
jgi:hypothetical protein